MARTKQEIEPAPFTRWSGGKQRLVKKLQSMLPAEFGNYYEPFVGAGSLFYKVYAGRWSYICDANEHLIATYRAIKEAPDALIILLDSYADGREKRVEEGTEAVFYKRLQKVDRTGEIEFWSDVRKAARFMYLMKCGFNGIWRINQSQQHNTPMGDVENPNICPRELIMACSKALKQTMIVNGDYRLFECMAEQGDLVYFDPPYIPLGKAHSQYTPKPFGKTQTIELKWLCDRLSAKGVYFMLSNSYCETTLDLFKDYKITEITTTRSVSCKADTRGKVKEIVVTNY